MTPEALRLEELRQRIQVLEKENELLAERAEEISLLGLVAEQIGSERETGAMLAGVLERVCVLKAFPLGACLEGGALRLPVQAFYHLRRSDSFRLSPLRLREGVAWPPAHPKAVAWEAREDWFQGFAVEGLQPRSMTLIPLRCQASPSGCFLFLDELRGADELATVLPLLERVRDLVQARLDNLALLTELRRVNLHLDLDVAERTEALRRSEQRYRTLFEWVPDGVLLVDANDEGAFGRIEEANQTAADLHGYTLAELKHLGIEALYVEDAGARAESFESRVWRLRPGETVREELLHRRKDGSTFPVEAIGTLVNILGRQYILEFSRDITERKEAERALLAAQRTESVGLLAGGIAHDFNNLLTAIMGQTSLALERLAEAHPCRLPLEKALAAADKAATLTQQMLAYSGRAKATLQEVSVNRMILENLRFLEASLPKSVRFEVQLEEGLPPVTADLAQLQQVVMNLVINGAEAIGPQGGRITVSTRALGLAQLDALPYHRTGQCLEAETYVQIEVADTGCGMPPEVADRIFDPFFTTKEKGHGLGLSAVQGIIRAHQGGLGVTSRPGQGTTFSVLLLAGAQPSDQPASQATPSVHERPHVVLAIDDEDFMLEVVQDLLELHGHEVLLARSGEEGLELMATQGDRVDLVLLDLTMPGLGGLETFRRLRERHPRLPVVLCSGFAEEEVLAQLGGLELTAFLQKPYRMEELARIVAAS